MPEGAVVRPPTAAEERLLRSTLAGKRKLLESYKRRVFIATLIICGVLWLASILASTFSKQKVSWWLITLFWLALAAVLAAWSYIPEQRRLSTELAKFEDALQTVRVIDVHVRSTRMVEFQEIEDEGACYAFQLDDGTIRFIRGQDYYASARFPNSDFSLAHLCSDQGELLECQIVKKGEKLKPIRVIPAPKKEKLNIPDHLAVIRGSVDELESLLG